MANGEEAIGARAVAAAPVVIRGSWRQREAVQSFFDGIAAAPAAPESGPQSGR